LYRWNLTDDVITVTITLITPFLVYLAADRAGASGTDRRGHPSVPWRA
jgi:hypothetical protein